MEKWKLVWSKLIPLTSENISSVSEEAGIYRLSKKEGDKIFVFYVGQGNIRDRLQKHISDTEPNERIKATLKSYQCYFRYSIITNQDVRNAAERKMVKVYQPDCNANFPQGRDDIDVNLEP